MPSIICRSTAGSLRPLPAICSASKIAGYKNVRFVPRSTCGFTQNTFPELLNIGLQIDGCDVSTGMSQKR